MPIGYDLDKIKFSTDMPTFQRAVGLYEGGKVTKVEECEGDYSAVVLGTKPYRVSVPARNYKYGHCTCYLGEQGTLCKHMVALALHAAMGGRPLSGNDKQLNNQVECSGRRGALSREEAAEVKRSISGAMRYIKAYTGPSRTWFANQDSLQEGCNRLSAIVSGLPVHKQAAEVLVKLLLRLDKKLCTGVDDSNGTVGGFMTEVVRLLTEYAHIDPDCVKAFKPLAGRETCFEWEGPLVRILDEKVQKPGTRPRGPDPR